MILKYLVVIAVCALAIGSCTTATAMAWAGLKGVLSSLAVVIILVMTMVYWIDS